MAATLGHSGDPSRSLIISPALSYSCIRYHLRSSRGDLAIVIAEDGFEPSRAFASGLWAPWHRPLVDPASIFSLTNIIIFILFVNTFLLALEERIELPTAWLQIRSSTYWSIPAKVIVFVKLLLAPITRALRYHSFPPRVTNPLHTLLARGVGTDVSIWTTGGIFPEFYFRNK